MPYIANTADSESIKLSTQQYEKIDGLWNNGHSDGGGFPLGAHDTSDVNAFAEIGELVHHSDGVDELAVYYDQSRDMFVAVTYYAYDTQTGLTATDSPWAYRVFFKEIKM
jgi:hypothetical protein